MDNDVTPLDIKKLAVQISTQSLEVALEQVCQINNRVELEEMGRLLVSIAEKADNPIAQYCAGQVFYDLSDNSSALSCFIQAGESGIGSASYRAAMILRGLDEPGSTVDIDSVKKVNSLLEKATRTGHVFARLALMRTRKKGPLGYVVYLFHRFIYGPAQVLFLGIFQSDSDKIRF